MSEPVAARRTVYSPDLRTAVVLTGTGADGAYHAGVLHALQEAGVRVDVLAGHGIGAVGALFAAIDGGARLWSPTGLWRSRSVARLYRWRGILRVLALSVAAGAPVLRCPPSCSPSGCWCTQRPGCWTSPGRERRRARRVPTWSSWRSCSGPMGCRPGCLALR